MQVTPIESDYQPNRYSYKVKCIKQTQADSLAHVNFAIWHKQSSANKCPVVFEHKIEVRCARPHSLQLNQLFVNNEESSVAQVSLIPKWKCPIKLSANLIVAYVDRPLLVQLIVKDALNNVFDNFTSLRVEWEIGNEKLLATTGQIKSIELSALEDRTGLVMLAEAESLLQKLDKGQVC